MSLLHLMPTRGAKDKMPAIVLGCHKIGLGVIRALGEEGVPVVGVYYNKMDMGHVSKYVVRSYHCPHPEEQQEFISFLAELANEWAGAVLMPSDDATLVPVSKNKEMLGKYFHVAVSDWHITQKLIVKKYTYSIADKIGVPAPKTFVPKTLGDALDSVDDMGFPCLLKPSVGHRFFDLFRKKMVVINDVDELADAYMRAEDAGMEMMLQELIPGDDTSGVNYNSYFAGGEPRVEVTAEKVRLTPPRTGFPRVVVSKHIPDVIAPGRKMLRALGYDGFSCVEFKRDSRDGIYKLMEINGRQNLSTPLSVKSGVNFPFMTYTHLVEGKMPEKRSSYKEGIYWIDIGKDIGESFKSYKSERFPISKYLEPYLKERVFTILSLKDPLPFLKRVIDILRAGTTLILRKSKGAFNMPKGAKQ